MKLLYISADNLRNANFIKELVWNFKNVGKAILLHDHFGKLGDTRFVTKRISALMSEEMIVNNALSGDQRSIFKIENGNIVVHKDFLDNAFKTVDLMILNPIALDADQAVATEAIEVAKAIRAAYGLDEIYIFPKNLRSPLSAERRELGIAKGEAELNLLRGVYEEEAIALDAAKALLPVVLASPSKFLEPVAK